MASPVKSMCAALIAAVLLAAAISPAAEAAVAGCGTVVSYLSACLPYVRNRGRLTGRCCGGVRGLYGAARRRSDRRRVCSCLKTLAHAYRGVNLGKASSLPRLCRLPIPYKIGPSTDCSRVR